MKIAFVVNQFPAISETFILRQIEGLLDRGHDVDIFAYGPGNESVRHPEINKYALLERTYYLTACACSKPAPVRIIKRLGLVFTNFRKDPPVVLKTLNVLKLGKAAVMLQVLCQVTPFLGKGPYDIIHCQFGNLGELGLLLRDVGVFNGKLITSFRGYDISSHVRSAADDIYGDLFKHGDLFLCVSENIKEKLIKLGCDQHKVVVHRSGVEIDYRRAHSRIVTSNEPVRVLTVARLTEKKGLEYGIRAIAKILTKFESIQYTIAGDGPLKDKLQTLVGKLGVGDKIRLVGWKSQDDIAELFENSQILLAPSITTDEGDEEGIPGVIMEGFTRGLPVVSTYHAGIPEVVKDGHSGFLVPERDVDALAERVEELINRPELRFRMGSNGLEFVKQHYDINKLNDRLVEIYENVLNGNSARAATKMESSPASQAHPPFV